MPIPKKIQTYLKKTEKKFEHLAHKTVYTAYDLAQTLKRDLKTTAKTLLVKTDAKYVLVVVPASARINLAKLKKALQAKKVSIPKENIMAKVFKVKPGAMSSFGGYHKIETIVDTSLSKAKDIVLAAGSLTDSVVMKARDFIAMENAKLANFSEPAKYKKIPSQPKK